MDDEVGTSPEEHLMRDSGHMKTSLQSVFDDCGGAAQPRRYSELLGS